MPSSAASRPSIDAKPRIVYLDAYTVNPGDLSFAPFEAIGSFTSYDRTPRELVIERAKDAEVIIVNKILLGEAEFDALPHLRLVCEAATGYDMIDTEAARRHGVTVCNCAGYSSRSVAQLVLSFILEVADSVASYAQRNREGDWSRCPYFCYSFRPRLELVGKRMAIVGFGNIGETVANVVRPLGLELFAVSSKPQEALPADVRKFSLEEAFATCHVVSLNCPLNAQNAGFVNAALLDKANPDLILVNTARGGLVNEHDVAQALQEGKLRAYCTDVLSVEPPLPDNPILHAANAYVTPHIGWHTPEARSRILDIVVGNIQAFLKGTPENVVN